MSQGRAHTLWPCPASGGPGLPCVSARLGLGLPSGTPVVMHQGHPVTSRERGRLKDPVSLQGDLHRCRGLGLQRDFWGHSCTHNVACTPNTAPPPPPGLEHFRPRTDLLAGKDSGLRYFADGSGPWNSGGGGRRGLRPPRGCPGPGLVAPQGSAVPQARCSGSVPGHGPPGGGGSHSRALAPCLVLVLKRFCSSKLETASGNPGPFGLHDGVGLRGAPSVPRVRS